MDRTVFFSFGPTQQVHPNLGSARQAAIDYIDEARLLGYPDWSTRIKYGTLKWNTENSCIDGFTHGVAKFCGENLVLKETP